MIFIIKFIYIYIIMEINIREAQIIDLPNSIIKESQVETNNFIMCDDEQKVYYEEKNEKDRYASEVLVVKLVDYTDDFKIGDVVFEKLKYPYKEFTHYILIDFSSSKKVIEKDYNVSEEILYDNLGVVITNIPKTESKFYYDGTKYYIAYSNAIELVYSEKIETQLSAISVDTIQNHIKNLEKKITEKEAYLRQFKVVNNLDNFFKTAQEKEIENMRKKHFLLKNNILWYKSTSARLEQNHPNKKRELFQELLKLIHEAKKFIIGQKKDIYKIQKAIIPEHYLTSILNLESPEEITLEDLTSEDIELMDQLLPEQIEDFNISEDLDEDALYEFIEKEIGDNDTMRNLGELNEDQWMELQILLEIPKLILSINDLSEENTKQKIIRWKKLYIATKNSIILFNSEKSQEILDNIPDEEKEILFKKITKQWWHYRKFSEKKKQSTSLTQSPKSKKSAWGNIKEIFDFGSSSPLTSSSPSPSSPFSPQSSDDHQSQSNFSLFPPPPKNPSLRSDRPPSKPSRKPIGRSAWNETPDPENLQPISQVPSPPPYPPPPDSSPRRRRPRNSSPRRKPQRDFSPRRYESKSEDYINVENLEGETKGEGEIGDEGEGKNLTEYLDKYQDEDQSEVATIFDWDKERQKQQEELKRQQEELERQQELKRQQEELERQEELKRQQELEGQKALEGQKVLEKQKTLKRQPEASKHEKVPVQPEVSLQPEVSVQSQIDLPIGIYDLGIFNQNIEKIKNDWDEVDEKVEKINEVIADERNKVPNSNEQRWTTIEELYSNIYENLKDQKFGMFSEPLSSMKIAIFKKLIIDTLYDYIEKHNISELQMPRGLEPEPEWINKDTINEIIDKYKKGELLPKKRDLLE